MFATKHALLTLVCILWTCCRCWGFTVASKLPLTLQNRFYGSSMRNRMPSLMASVETDTLNETSAKREIKVSTSMELPFPCETAFDVFSDLPRQAQFSPWIKSVEYTTPDQMETKWTVGVKGMNFSWIAKTNRMERPNVVEWESKSGMKNFGQVQFLPQGNDASVITMTMTFKAPRVVASVFRRASAVTAYVENKMIRTTLLNFRDSVVAEQSGVANAIDTDL